MAENIEKYIVEQASKVFKTTDIQIVKRLEGGMSNYTYVIQADGRKYTYRVPGQNAEEFVNREEELAHIQAVDSLGLNNRTVYFDIKSGEKAAEYVEGTILSQTDDVSRYDAQSAAALHKLHNSHVVLKPYAAFDRLARYEQLCREQHHVFHDGYKTCIDRLQAMRPAYESLPQVPCHCDYQPTNLVVGKDRFYVLDWEFAGMNDPYYDIACYGNVSMPAAESLLAAYLGRTPDAADLKRLYFHRTYQFLQWYNVAIFKDGVGLSRALNMDFNQIALMFLGFATDLMGKIDRLG